MKEEELRSGILRSFISKLDSVSATIQYDTEDALERAQSEGEFIAYMLAALNALQGELNEALKRVSEGAKEIGVEIGECQRAHMESIRTCRVIDEYPDLSYLETTASSHFGKDGANWLHVSREDRIKVVKEHGTVWDACIAYALQDKERLAAYNRGEWHMLGISAKATVLIPTETVPPSWKIQEITSGGLWGIESDSDEEYLKQVEDEQVAELRRYLQILNVTGADTCEVTRE